MNNKVVGFSSVSNDELMNVDGGGVLGVIICSIIIMCVATPKVY